MGLHCLAVEAHIRESEALYFSRWPFRQFRENADVFGGLVLAKVINAVAQEFVFAAAYPRFQGNAGHDLLTIVLVRYPNRCRFQHCRVPVEDLVDLARGDILRTAYDELFDSKAILQLSQMREESLGDSSRF